MAANAQDVIMLFGDSLTEQAFDAGGFGQKLSEVYARKLDVLNRGLSGYNTRWALPVLEQVFAKKDEQPHVPNVRLLTIWLGANDAAIPSTHRQHVPLAEYTSNLSAHIKLIRDPSSEHYSASTRVVVITPPPFNAHQWGAHKAPQPVDRAFEVTKAYVDAAREVADKEGVPLCDVWTPMWKGCGEVEEKLSLYLSDGLHLNAEGYKVVYDELIKVINANFPEVHYQKLQEVFPLYYDVDLANPRPSIVKRVA